MEPKILLERSIESKEALTFDDVLLEPGYSDISQFSQLDLRTRLTRNIEINIPIMSAAMDTVTDSVLAIALAREGGIGIIHRNMTIEKQVDEVAKVKRHESGMVRNPVTLTEDRTIKYARDLMKKNNISGIPVTKDDKLVGMLTNRDLRFEDSLDKKVSELMTTKLVTASEGITLEEAERILHKYKIEKLPIVDKDYNLKGLITSKDIEIRLKYPNAFKDEHGRLRVGAAIGTDRSMIRRLEALLEANVDVIVIDKAHGHTAEIIKAMERIKKDYNIEIIAGNVVTREGAKALIESGADAIKVGLGSADICTTREVTGVGKPQIIAVYECAKAADEYNIPVISDGGIVYSGDIAKAIAAGANSVMIGGLFAGTEESPGDNIIYEGRKYKYIRGMGSEGAIRSGVMDRYLQNGDRVIPEGIEGMVPYKGSVSDLLYYLLGGLKKSMVYTGSKSIEELREKVDFIKITNAGVRESHVHNVKATRESPNYSQVQ